MLLVVSILISVFLFAFLNNTVSSICYRYLEHTEKFNNGYFLSVVHIWVQGICLLASAVFFVIIFLFLLGQKLLYLQEIISGIEALRTHRMDYRIPVEGDNEFTELAQSINYLSQTEQQLIRKEEALTAEREQFIRSIAHDIRTPITSVMSYSELLASKENRTEEEIDAYIHLTLRKGQQIKELMERLLENDVRHMEYFENGQLLLQQIVDDWESVLSESFSVEIDWSECSNFKGYFDIQEIFRVFDNLLSNIKKYADAQKSVILRISVQENHLKLEQSNYIQTNHQKAESHQLGLQTITRIISWHGGTVDWQYTDDQFKITIKIPVNV